MRAERTLGCLSTESGDSVSLITSINCIELKEVDTLVKFKRWKKRTELWSSLGGAGFRKSEVEAWESLFLISLQVILMWLKDSSLSQRNVDCSIGCKYRNLGIFIFRIHKSSHVQELLLLSRPQTSRTLWRGGWLTLDVGLQLSWTHYPSWAVHTKSFVSSLWWHLSPRHGAQQNDWPSGKETNSEKRDMLQKYIDIFTYLTTCPF